ncbi:MAG: MATE family efflux transporter [Saprospiraceae bacterium]|nr:MATE family efflux transporter [Saprospiraceae bacterium]
MKLSLSYRRIIAISLPIMIGSAAQNIIALTDSIFLYHNSETDFAAIGFVGVFYLIIMAIGYGFSRGGQILIARRVGEEDMPAAGRHYYAMLLLEVILAVILFGLIKLGARHFFDFFIDSPAILEKSLEYLKFRVWGLFPAFVGVAVVAFYTGIARTKFILIDTAVLIVVNIALNYSLIYGRWGLPEMGIAGAGLASSLAELVALLVFVVYMFFDRKLGRFLLRRIPAFRVDLIIQTLRMGSPIVAQAVVGLGSWFVFFSLIENMGERPLAVSNLVRIVYLILSIPCWGYCVGVNTLVSNFMGQNEPRMVGPAIDKTIRICVVSTLMLAIPVLLFPATVLYPFFGSQDMSLFVEAQPIFYVLFVILTLFSIGGVYFNGMIGTGATWEGLKVQAICAAVYMVLIYLVINVWQQGLVVSWAIEIAYWVPLIFLVRRYMYKGFWRRLKV